MNHAGEYTHDLLNLLQLYQQHYPQPVVAIQAQSDAIDLDFLQEDLPKLLTSMKVGAERIQTIVLALRSFSRIDEAEVKAVNIHDGIDSTLMILQSRLKATAGQPAIQVLKDYGDLPLVECYAGQLNQVFMNILSNAIDALDDYNRQRSAAEQRQQPATITIQTALVVDHSTTEPDPAHGIQIRIAVRFALQIMVQVCLNPSVSDCLSPFLPQSRLGKARAWVYRLAIRSWSKSTGAICPVVRRLVKEPSS